MTEEGISRHLRELISAGRFGQAIAESAVALENAPGDLDHWSVRFLACVAERRWSELFQAGPKSAPVDAAEGHARSERLAEALVCYGVGGEFRAFWDNCRAAGILQAETVDEIDRTLQGAAPAAAGSSHPEPVGNGTGARLASYLRVLAAWHLFEQAGDRGNWARAAVGRWIEPMLRTGPGHDTVEPIAFLTNVAGYGLASSPEWNEAVLGDAVVPATRRAIENAEWNLACAMEVCTAMGIGRQPPTDAHAAACFEKVRPLLEQAAVVPGPSSPIAVSPQRPLRVAFLGYALAASSPMKVVAELIMARNASSDAWPWIAGLVTLTTVSEGVLQFSKDWQVPIIDLTGLLGPLSRARLQDRIEDLRLVLRQHEIDALVHFDVFDGYATLLSKARLVPIQVYWSMGHYHAPCGPQWDGLLSIGAPGQLERDIGGRRWRAVELAVPDQHSGVSGERLKAEGESIRKRLPSGTDFVLATMGRPEKLDNEDFVSTLARILETVPRACFLWFGSEESPSVRRRMQERGISDRCLFQGFQDIAAYAHAIDLHLDSFPFPGGYTVFETMAASKPTVFMDTVDARQTGVLRDILPLVEGVSGSTDDCRLARSIFHTESGGDSLLYMARDEDEYVSMARRLLSDPALRVASGAANRRFMESFKFDRMRQLKSFSHHFEEIVGNVARRGSPG